MKTIKYSIIAPVYNEEKSVIPFYKEIAQVMKKLKGNYEIIFINDGSTDKTLEKLKTLSPVKIIDLNRNYGQSTALDAGFREAQGKLIITMDTDMQNDPHDIPKLLKKLQEKNLDVVTGWRKVRKDKADIRILSSIGSVFRKILISDSVHDTGCTLRVYRKQAAKSLEIQGEMHRYIITLLRWKGFRVGEVVVNHRPRKYGESKYHWQKAIKGFVDLLYVWFINKYSQRPLHLFGSIGIGSVFLGFLTEGWIVYEKITRNIDLSNNAWFILGFFLIIGGIIFFSFGITLDLLIRTTIQTSPYQKRYHIREIIEK